MELLISILKNMPDALSLGLVWGIMAIGVYITFKVLDIPDMTVDGTFALGGCIVAATITAGMNPIVAMVIAVACGMMAGLVTGILHTKLKIPAILAGILTMLAIYSIDLMILGGKSNIGMAQFGNMKVTTVLDAISEMLGLSAKMTNLTIGVVLAVAIIAVLYWFFGTEIGCLIRATGINEDMVKAQGGNTQMMKILGLIIANGLVAFSGGLVAQIQRYGDVGMGTGTIVIGLASIIIGEVLLGKRSSFKVRLTSVFVGSMIYRVIIAIVLLLGFNPNNLKLLTAVLVIIALSMPVAREYMLEKNQIKQNLKKYQEVN
ncbi:MAG: ABC transporter permease [Firmicutes bacterium]|nr:ABC transporter permease [Bacillota bacterium]